MSWIAITFALLALAFGIWLGLGAPGWPHKDQPAGPRRRLEKRSINPISWKRQESGGTSRRRRR